MRLVIYLYFTANTQNYIFSLYIFFHFITLAKREAHKNLYIPIYTSQVSNKITANCLIQNMLYIQIGCVLLEGKFQRVTCNCLTSQ